MRVIAAVMAAVLLLASCAIRTPCLDCIMWVRVSDANYVAMRRAVPTRLFGSLVRRQEGWMLLWPDGTVIGGPWATLEKAESEGDSKF